MGVAVEGRAKGMVVTGTAEGTEEGGTRLGMGGGGGLAFLELFSKSRSKGVSVFSLSPTSAAS